MDQFTQNQSKPRATTLPATGGPGWLDRCFLGNMKAHRMPSGVTSRFRKEIQKEKARNITEAPRRIYDWFVKELLPEFEAINKKQPLSDEVIEWLSSFLVKLIDDDKYCLIPPDAVQKVCEFANNIAKNFLAKRPPISLTSLYCIIWYAMLLLGAEGREFAFSGEAFAKALTETLGQTIQSMRVYRVIKCFLGTGLIVQCKQGRKYGNCGTYRLKDEFKYTWEELGANPIIGDKAITAKEIQDMFPWIFQCLD